MQTPAKSPETRYREALSQGRFEIQHCGACASVMFPPRIACCACGSSALEWRPATGRGTVHASTVVAQRPEKGGPYNVVLVDLEEGGRMMSHVAGYGARDVPIGLVVSARIETETARVVFDAADAGERA